MVLADLGKKLSAALAKMQTSDVVDETVLKVHEDREVVVEGEGGGGVVDVNRRVVCEGTAQGGWQGVA